MKERPINPEDMPLYNKRPYKNTMATLDEIEDDADNVYEERRQAALDDMMEKDHD
jgi:hypothetical protein